LIKIPEAATRNLRSFGLGAAAILSVFSFLSWRKAGVTYVYLLSAAGFFAALGLIIPKALRPVYRVWMKVAGAIAAINTFLILAAVYYAMITPYALWRRMLGDDPLDLAYDKKGSTYWKTRPETADPKTYERQF